MKRLRMRWLLWKRRRWQRRAAEVAEELCNLEDVQEEGFVGAILGRLPGVRDVRLTWRSEAGYFVAKCHIDGNWHQACSPSMVRAAVLLAEAVYRRHRHVVCELGAKLKRGN